MDSFAYSGICLTFVQIFCKIFALVDKALFFIYIGAWWRLTHSNLTQKISGFIKK